jgi:hypothetical protein
VGLRQDSNTLSHILGYLLRSSHSYHHNRRGRGHWECEGKERVRVREGDRGRKVEEEEGR